MGIDINEEEQLYAERQAMFEQETRMLRDCGSPAIVAKELIKLRQRVSALEAENVIHSGQIGDLEEVMRAFRDGIEKIPYL